MARCTWLITCGLAVMLGPLCLPACGDDDAPESEPNGESDAGMKGVAGAGDRGGNGDQAGRGGSPESHDAGAAGTFSAEHKNEIRRDCTESVQCRAQMAQGLPEHAIEMCEHNSAEVLDAATPAKQANFLERFSRCEHFVVCDYYTCASMP